MAELERLPKNSHAFLNQVSELRRIFQQHIRDDRKEVLPAVLKVLSDEEAEAVAEKVEDEMATVEESKRAEVRRTREQAEAIQQVTDDAADILRAGIEGFQSMARTMQQALENSFRCRLRNDPPLDRPGDAGVQLASPGEMHKA